MKHCLPRILWGVTLLSAVGIGMPFGQGQSGDETQSEVPVSTQWVLDVAGPTQRTAIKSVYLLFCPKTSKKGTAFLLKSGIMVTDNHVVDGCKANDLWAMSPMGERISFSKLVTDPNRDLALLRSTQRLQGPSREESTWPR